MKKIFIQLSIIILVISSTASISQNISDTIFSKPDSLYLTGNDSLLLLVGDSVAIENSDSIFSDKEGMDTISDQGKSILLDTTHEIIVDSTLLEYFTYNPLYEINKYAVDTSLYFIHNYNPLYKDKNKIFASLGNIGLAADALVYEIESDEIFSFENDAYTPYLFNARKLDYYNLVRPYTEINYVTGAKKEQFFDIRHSQNIGNSITSSLEYRLMNSPGKYAKQGAENANFSLNFKIRSPQSRYVSYIAYTHNRIKVSENGGIIDKEAFEAEPDYNANVAFPRAHKTTNTKKTNTYYLDHSIAFGRYKLLDSTDNIYKHGIGYLGHQFCFDRKWSIYYDSDPTVGYYPFVYKDTLATNDSIYNKIIDNTAYWSNFRSETYDRKLNFRFSITHQYIDIAQSDEALAYQMFNFYDTLYYNEEHETQYLESKKDLYNNLTPQVFINIRDIKGFNLIIDGKFTLGGYNKEDFLFSPKLIKDFKDSLNLYASINYSQKETDWIFQHYTSNNFIWDYNFDKVTLRYISLGSQSDKFRYNINAKFGQILNHTYFDEYCRPKQYKDELNFLQLSAHKKFSFWKFDLNNFVTYQFFDYTNVIHLPKFVSFNSFYIKFDLFNKALYSQIGADVTYTSAYYANSYMPALRQFYLQNTEELGNYPYIDVFANFKIKRVRMFVKFEHINAGTMGNDYYKVPNYPFDGRSFKFGVYWKFFE